jgi:exopolyphosphatase/guanosine-5'-triphosphate,3'-diphosphate pyrophosphatase
MSDSLHVPAAPGTDEAAVPAPIRLCTVDIGSNSTRSLVVEATGPEDYRVLDDERIQTRLGEAVAATGALSETAMSRTLDAMGKLLAIGHGHGVAAVRAVTTSAVRDARNGPEFLRRVRERHGVELEVISGEREAYLAFVSARRGLAAEGLPYCVMDLGGGSLELVIAAGGAVEEIFSLPLGAVRLTEGFVRSDPIREDDFVGRSLRAAMGRRPRAIPLVIGSGGTISALATMAQASTGKQNLRLSGYELYRSEVQHLRDFLARQTLAERRRTPGLAADRADIIVAGVTVVNQVMKHLGANLLRHNPRGVREGLVLETLAQRFGTSFPASPSTRLDVARRFAALCRVEATHSQQVCKLALELFDGVRRRFALSEGDRQLLEAAALLHDVGYSIDYTRHHKHAYHLIRHAPLQGFSARETEIVALVARYHRGAEPRKRHEGFRQLDPPDRRRVRRLAALLRLADGLDRSHAARVVDLEIYNEPDRVRVVARGVGDLEVEAWGVERKASLFARAYGVPAQVEVAHGAPGPPETPASP